VDDLEYRAIFNESNEVRVFAYSLLEVSLATIQEIALIDDGKLFAPEQAWGDPIKYAQFPVPDGWEVIVEITDEGNKLPLNTMPEAQLNQLLEESLELDFGTTRELSSSLLDWIDADSERRLNGAESEDYLDRDPPYKAANGPLQSLEELRLVNIWDETFFDSQGQPNELYTQLSGHVSVIYDGPVNLNAANQSILELLALEGGWDSRVLFDGLDEPYLQELPASVSNPNAGVTTQLLHIQIRVQRGNVPFTLSALVSPNFNDAGAEATGSAEPDAVKTGTIEEQDRIKYPFKLLQVSEYEGNTLKEAAARYSSVDIERENLSF
jgi:general secretion pathway protein K